MPVVLLNGVDLLHGHRVEAHGIFQHTVLVKQRNSHRHDIFMGVVDGLGGGDLFLLPDDLRSDTGPEGPVRFQIKSRLAHDGIVGKAKVPLIVLTDPENDAVRVREHHIVCQDQIISGAEDIEKSLQIDIFLKEMRKVRCMRHESTSRVRSIHF